MEWNEKSDIFSLQDFATRSLSESNTGGDDVSATPEEEDELAPFQIRRCWEMTYVEKQQN